jgi:ATP-dependent DNA helicase RecQ
MNRKDAELLLKKKFGYEKFYDKQWETIEKVLNGERVLLIEKTGFGKSLCFQFPAIIFPDTTVIFSPLIALMRDQVKKLNNIGISARCINSEQDSGENRRIMAEARSGKVKILYIAPERQEDEDWIEVTVQLNLSMIVIDEAHCISEWGHDFRPSFKRIINLVKLLPKKFPVLATTATATKRVEKDVAEQIGGNITILRGHLMRPNFRLYVITVNSDDEKMAWLGEYLCRMPGSGIIYSGTRIDTEVYAKWLEYLNIPSTNYNAGLDSGTRIEIENGLMTNKWKCIVATNALGMGIDKPDIRFIIHTQIPQSPIHYYQEIGRAGRDNKPAFIILFYGPDDRSLPEAFIEGSRPPVYKYERVISAVRHELLGEYEIMKQINLRRNQFRVIKADLIDQGIIREVRFGKSRKFEYVTNAPALNTKIFEELREAKRIDLEKMVEYVGIKSSRMQYLCDYLGDLSKCNFTNCDNTGLHKLTANLSPAWNEKLNHFRENYFPELLVESKGSNLVNGIAASYYGFSNVGSAIHRSKYENGGDFPDFLLKLTLKAYNKRFGKDHFDFILFVPPTKSGNLVKNFATKISQMLNIPLSEDLVKVKTTREQKIFENHLLKENNIKNAFRINNPDCIEGKSILLIDDICDSGATIREIGKLLTGCGAGKIAPLVIARTVGGDLK